MTSRRARAIPLPAVEPSTDALLEAAAIAHRGIEELRAENRILKDRLDASEIAHDSCDAQCQWLEAEVRRITIDRDRYQRLTIELTTQLQNVKVLIEDCFVRALEAADASQQSTEAAAAAPTEAPTIPQFLTTKPKE